MLEAEFELSKIERTIPPPRRQLSRQQICFSIEGALYLKLVLCYLLFYFGFLGALDLHVPDQSCEQEADA